MSNIPQEQPPEEPTLLREWLTRMMLLINGALDAVYTLPIFSSLPDYMPEGLIQFFNRAIEPEIDYPGPWVVVDGVWRPLVGMVFNPDYNNNDLSYPQDVVSIGGYVMVCNTKTTEPAEPFPIGVPDFIVPDAPAWVQAGINESVYTAISIVIPENTAYRIQAYRFWAPSIDASYTYEVWTEDLTDPSRPVFTNISTHVGDTLELGWNTFNRVGSLLGEGVAFRLILVTTNSLGNVVVAGGWTKDSTSQNSGPEISGWNTNNQQGILRISTTDLDAADRTGELMSMSSGTGISFVDVAESNRSTNFTVIGDPVDSTTYVQYTVSHDADGPFGAPTVGATTTMTATTLTPSNTEYVTLLDGSSALPNAQGGISLTGSYSDLTLNNNLYGIDAEFVQYSKSDDWDLLSVEGGSSAGGSSASLVLTNLPEITLLEGDPETQIGELFMIGQRTGIWRFGFDIVWYITGQGGTAHRALFRLYTVTDGVATLAFTYAREPKDPNETDWSTKGIYLTYTGSFDSVRLTLEQSNGAANPSLVAGSTNSNLYMEFKQ